MKNQRTIAGIAAASILGVWVLGCANQGQRLANFLQTPRSPVSGIEYIVLPPDELALASMQVSEIDGFSQQIGPDGKIVMPLLGEVFVAGMTRKEVEAAITDAAQEFYKKPDVTVHVAQYNSQKFYVLGQVSLPGPVRWTGTDTLLDVLAQRRPTNLAWPERIKVIRPQEPLRGGHMPGDNPYVPPDTEEKRELRAEKEEQGLNTAGAEEVTVDLMAMMKTGDLSHNLLLRPGDIVYVPANPFATVGLALRTILFPVSPVLEAARVPYDLEYAANPDRRARDRDDD